MTGELARQANVLTAATDGQRQLIVGHHHFDAAIIFVEHNAADGSRLERVDHEGRGVFRPGDDVDLFALQFLHDSLHAAALHADAGANRVNGGIAADHTDLGAATRVTGGGLDLDDVVVDFGHFLREQLLHEVGVRAAEEDLRTAVVALHLCDKRTDALTGTGGFARDLLIAADHAFGTAKVDDHVAEFDRLDDAGDDFALTILEFFELTLALGIADLLEDHLLGGLRIDAAQIDRGQRIDDEVADLGSGLELFALLDVNLLEVVFDLFDDLDHAPQRQIAGQRIELGANIVLRTIAVARGFLDRLFHRLNDDGLVDHLFRSDRVGNRKQFSLVGGNGTHQSSAFSVSSMSSSAPLVSSGRVAAISASVRTSLAV